MGIQVIYAVCVTLLIVMASYLGYVETGKGIDYMNIRDPSLPSYDFCRWFAG